MKLFIVMTVVALAAVWFFFTLKGDLEKNIESIGSNAVLMTEKLQRLTIFVPLIESATLPSTNSSGVGTNTVVN